jgi:glucose/arabinose dehydrogenase
MENGVDHLGNDAPNDVMYRVEEGRHYGWPYCYESDGEKLADTTQVWEREPLSCAEVPLSFSAFEPHSAPLGFSYFEEAHPALEGAFIVALQGSWVPEIGGGYQLMRVSKEGAQEVFMDGFLTEAKERVGRPVGILQASEDSFFVTDDYAGKLYYIYAAR